VSIPVNRATLLKVAEEKTSEAQVAKVHELAARKSKTGKKSRSPGVMQKVTREADFETPLSADDQKYLADLVKKWNAARELKGAFIKASSTVREQFIAKIRQDRSPDTAQGRWGE
jgi:hypothetical protein